MSEEILSYRRFRDGHDDRDGGDRGERGAWGRDRGNRDDKTEQPWVRMGEGASNSPTSERPRLNLKPRTAPVNNEERKTDKPNPFGKAKPVDVRESPEGGERKPAPKVCLYLKMFLKLKMKRGTHLAAFKIPLSTPFKYKTT